MFVFKKKKEEEGEAAAAAAAEPAGVAGAATKRTVLGVGRGRGRGGKTKRTKPAVLRLQKDLAELDKSASADLSWPNKDNLTNMHLKLTITEGLWTGAEYHFDLQIPDGYPHDSPKVLCKTKVYHPNIDFDGNVCLNILREGWKPVFDLNTVIFGLTFLFHNPNPDDPLNHDAAALMRDNRAAFERNVQRSLRGYSVEGQSFPRLV